MLSSSHHVEMNPSDAGFQDRYVVQEVIKEMAKSRPIDAKGKRAFKGWVLFLSYTVTLILLLYSSRLFIVLQSECCYLFFPMQYC